VILTTWATKRNAGVTFDSRGGWRFDAYGAAPTPRIRDVDWSAVRIGTRFVVAWPFARYAAGFRLEVIEPGVDGIVLAVYAGRRGGVPRFSSTITPGTRTLKLSPPVAVEGTPEADRLVLWARACRASKAATRSIVEINTTEPTS
jgi:hypothetical protein